MLALLFRRPGGLSYVLAVVVTVNMLCSFTNIGGDSVVALTKLT